MRHCRLLVNRQLQQLCQYHRVVRCVLLMGQCYFLRLDHPDHMGNVLFSDMVFVLSEKGEWIKQVQIMHVWLRLWTSLILNRCHFFVGHTCRFKFQRYAESVSLRPTNLNNPPRNIRYSLMNLSRNVRCALIVSISHTINRQIIYT